MKTIATLTAATLLAAPAYAESHVTGDAEAGGEAFNRQCVACHVVENAEGEIVAGRKARTGPNLYGVVNRQLGTVEDFKYGDAMIEAGAENGLTWTEENFVGYVQDPTPWLRETLDDRRARGKMAFKVRKEEDAINIYAYLASIGPDMMMEEGAMEEDAEAAESN
jgi:cytochrome c